MAEAGEVVDVEAKARRVDEDDFAAHANLERRLRQQQLPTLRRDLDQCFLYCRVFQRIELDGAQRTVKREDQTAARPANRSAVSGLEDGVDVEDQRLATARHLRHGVPPRSARATE